MIDQSQHDEPAAVERRWKMMVVMVTIFVGTCIALCVLLACWLAGWLVEGFGGGGRWCC